MIARNFRETRSFQRGPDLLCRIVFHAVDELFKLFKQSHLRSSLETSLLPSCHQVQSDRLRSLSASDAILRQAILINKHRISFVLVLPNHFYYIPRAEDNQEESRLLHILKAGDDTG